MFEDSLKARLDVHPQHFFRIRRYIRGRRRTNELESKAVLSHVIPAGPEIRSPVSSNDDPPVVEPDDLLIGVIS